MSFYALIDFRQHRQPLPDAKDNFVHVTFCDEELTTAELRFGNNAPIKIELS
jgi:hypothetical protein